MEKLKVGIVGLMHRNFRGDKEGIYLKSIEGLQDLSKELGFDFYYVKDGIISEDDARTAVKEIIEQKVDFLLVQNSSFSSGNVMPILARSGAYIGLWAVPEPSSKGKLLLNSFCGMNMNSSIIADYMKDEGIKYKWFFGNIDDELFIDRFKVTVKALTVIKNLKKARIALIGGVADGFLDQAFDERKIKERFGIYVNKTLEFSDIKNRALSYKQEEIADIIEAFEKDAVSITPLAKESMEKNARLYKALIDIKSEYNFDALAINCWPKFRLEMGMVACAAIGRLNGYDFVTACEGDVYGLIAMMILYYLSQQPSLLMDMTNFDEEDNTVLFWHCGIGCKQLAYQEKLWYSEHYNPTPINGKKVEFAPVAEMVFKPEKATAIRFADEGQKMLLLEGQFVNPDKESYDGSRGWFGDIKLNGEAIKVRDLVNTIIVHGIQHHYSIGIGAFTDEMLEIAAWLGIKPIEKVRYARHLQVY